MNKEIVRLKKEDYSEAMDLLNLAFGCTDFPSILTKVYEPNDEKMSCNLAVKRNGDIRAIVGVFPVSVFVAGNMLKAAVIGGVSVHPDDRGKGYMKLLMEESQKVIREAGYHFTCLGGLRQRYSHYNYENAGTILNFTFNRSDLRHCKDYWAGAEEIRFQRIEEGDDHLLDFVDSRYRSQPFYIGRNKENLYRHITTWNSEPLAAFDSASNIIGYICETGTKINEISALTPLLMGQIVYNRVMNSESIDKSLVLPPWEYEYIKIAGLMYESLFVKSAYMFQIIDWVNVIKALTIMKAEKVPLVDGELVFAIEDHGRVLLNIDKGVVSCERTAKDADLKLDRGIAARLVFGPLTSVYVSDADERSTRLLMSWFPLPLSWLPIDGA